MKGPSWDHSGSSLLPSMLVLAWSKPSILGPISLLASFCRPSIFHLCPPFPTQKSLFLWWLVSEGGMLGEWQSLFFLIPTISTSPWPAGPVVPPSQGRGAPGEEGLGEEPWERLGYQKGGP